jgi:predicted ATPase
MHPGPGEPVFGNWQAIPLGEFVERLLSARPRVMAVDGRSGGGKSTLADRLAAEIAGAAVVHVDDVAAASLVVVEGVAAGQRELAGA